MTVKANLKRLSLAAPANWVQKKGAKRRWPSRANWLACEGVSGAGTGEASAVDVIRDGKGALSGRHGNRRIVPHRLAADGLQRLQHRQRRQGSRHVLEAEAGQQVVR